MDLGLEFQKTNINIFEILCVHVCVCVCVCVCASFQLKQTAWTFPVQICPKADLGLAIQKTIVRIRIRNLNIPCVPMFSQNEQL